MKFTFFIFLLFVVGNSLLAQSRLIKGNVKDSNHQPLKGVSISNISGDYSVSSDLKGNYKIYLPDSVTSLVYSKIGYYIVTENIKNKEVIDVTLKGLELVELSLKDLLQVNVSTVSLSEQKIVEAPGVVSIITQEDMRLMGVRTIREALTLIPGFTVLQNDDEHILAVRGIFATTNQKILVMRDGHSLNEANIDMPQTDYSLSIENIKKIEIIRGPGASIYGNSAVAAVVNIITNDQEGSSVKFGLGNYGQFNLEAVSCKKINKDSYFMAFGRFTGTSGQSYKVNAQRAPGIDFNGTYYTNHYPSNFDIGFNYKYNIFTTSLSLQHYSYKTYWSVQGVYTNVDSLLSKPGLKQESLHYGFSLNPKINEKISLHLQHYIDYSQLNNSRLLSPIDNVKYLNGRIQLNEWNVLKAGLNYYSTWQYSNNGQMVGGISLEQRRYLDSWQASNTMDSSQIVYANLPFFAKGTEIRAAGFLQMQQPIYEWLKIDCGARFDWAENYNATFNPRVALIANLYDLLTFKTIFTKAFQAPGYSYRTSNADYSGSINLLQPERLTTYQAALRYEWMKTSFIEVTGYYNRLSNLISRQIGYNFYSNFGKYASYGMEVETAVHIHNSKIVFNYSLLLPDIHYLDSISKETIIRQNEFRFFPKHSINAGVISKVNNFLSVSLYGQYASRSYAVNNTIIKQRIILNMSVMLQEIMKRTNVQLSFYNLTNKKYKLGDPSVTPIEQPGRWYMVSIIYSINSKS